MLIDNGRFGLRTDQVNAVARAHYFMNWFPQQSAEATREVVHQKKFMICKLPITIVGYTTDMEEGILEQVMATTITVKDITDGGDI